MATAAESIREYLKDHPEATADEVTKKFGVTPAHFYSTRRKMQGKPAAKKKVVSKKRKAADITALVPLHPATLHSAPQPLSATKAMVIIADTKDLAFILSGALQ